MKKKNLPEIILYGVIPVMGIALGYYMWKQHEAKEKSGALSADKS